MGKVHVVKSGEHAHRIAWENGFADYALLWNDPNNAELAQSRNPCVLAEGDEVFIPDRKTPKAVSRGVESLHKFKVKRPKIKLKLTLRDVSGQPIANVPCTLKIDGDAFSVTSTGEGEVEHAIAIDTESCSIAFLDQEIALLVGWLAPVDQPAGCRSRLNNLGYDPGSEDDDDDGAILRSAIEEFQCDNGLEVTGDLDDATQSKLVEIHGS